MADLSLEYLTTVSPEYIEQMSALYKTNPSELPLSWRLFFDGIEIGKNANGQNHELGQNGLSDGTDVSTQSFREHQVAQLIQAYRQRGHLLAKLDPLGRNPARPPAYLEPKYFSLEQIPRELKFAVAEEIGLPASTLTEIINHLHKTYAHKIGVEYSHISDEKSRRWLEKRMEPVANQSQFSNQQKRQFLNDIAEATLFEDYLQKNFTGQKRFSLEGAEPLIPAMKQIVRKASEQDSKEVTIGMAHRGRLNVLVNVLRKPYEDVFNEFFGATYSEKFNGSGDVKYHMGYSREVDVNGKSLHMSLAFNPSHLEAVDPVVLGIAKAKQVERYANDPNSIVPILIHGDAAVIGQGIVCETMNFSDINGYSTGGTLHIVINNQIGFTTLPEEARSGVYCTDFAKAIQAPILHVNGDDVEAVVHAITLASDFRREFKRDVFVDLYCYRRYGHNEGDEPRFTQPDMYNLIGQKKNALTIYEEQLKAENQVDEAFCQSTREKIGKDLEAAFQKAKETPKKFDIDSLKRNWHGLREAGEADILTPFSAPITAATLETSLKVIHDMPADLKLLPKFRRMLESRLEKIQETGLIDWAVGEQIAYATLLQEGYSVRLSGQDCKRGTFSHRHVELIESENGRRHQPLKALESAQAKFFVYNSPLSEFSILGFDFGYASASPNTLTIWEAQFGDFANGAQVIIDQFIASSEAKWRRMNGLVMLLPHGYEGQGPEHSSARLERYLQLAGEGNLQVAYPTTPAQICHLLRRQVRRDFRKPLIIMAPKSPLRMPEVVSSKDDFLKGQFHPLLFSGAAPDHAQRLIFCSGKIYWDLLKLAEASGQLAKTSFVRVEQIYPLDPAAIKEIQKKYKNVKDWVWCQEEPKNMGAWAHIRLATLELNLPLRYAGRPAAASPATGSNKRHIIEQEKLLKLALEINS